MIIEESVKKLEDELKALKATFEKSALQLPVFTKSIDFTTLKNTCTEIRDGYSYTFDGSERVVVTFDTATGANTLATLEFTTNNPYYDLKTKRVPYSGGARWVVYANSNFDENYNWLPTEYNFTVQSAVDGMLGAKMIWQ